MHATKIASTVGFLVFITGCTQSLYKDTVDQFHTAFQSTSKIVATTDDALANAKQRKHSEMALYGDPPPPEHSRLVSFANQVCSSSDYLRGQKSALATLGVYDQVLQITDAAPKQNIPDLMGSITSNWKNAPALQPKEVASPSSLACNEEVQNLILLDEKILPEAAGALGILAVLGSAETLVAAANAVAVKTLSLTDDVVRTRKLRAYVRSSHDVLYSDVLPALETADPQVDSICKSMPAGEYTPPCRRGTEGDPLTRLDGVCQRSCRMASSAVLYPW